MQHNASISKKMSCRQLEFFNLVPIRLTIRRQECRVPVWVGLLPVLFLTLHIDNEATRTVSPIPITIAKIS